MAQLVLRERLGGRAGEVAPRHGEAFERLELRGGLGEDFGRGGLHVRVLGDVDVPEPRGERGVADRGEVGALELTVSEAERGDVLSSLPVGDAFEDAGEGGVVVQDGAVEAHGLEAVEEAAVDRFEHGLLAHAEVGEREVCEVGEGVEVVADLGDVGGAVAADLE